MKQCDGILNKVFFVILITNWFMRVTCCSSVLISLMSTAFGPIIDRSGDAAQGFILYERTSPYEERLYDIGPTVGGFMRDRD